MAHRGVPPSAVVHDQLAQNMKDRFKEFIDTYSEGVDARGVEQYIYRAQLGEMKQTDRTTLHVAHSHLLAFCGVAWAESLSRHYYRVAEYLRQAVQDVMRKYHPQYVVDENVDKEFWVSFYRLAGTQTIRGLKASTLGQLVCFSGTVTRTSEVRPELLYGTFECQDCGNEVKMLEQQFKYTEPTMCPGPSCENRHSWTLRVERSRFSDWQRVRVQENSQEIPAGSMPRTMDVILRHEMVERAKAGDRCFFTGCLIVVPDVSQINTPGIRTQSFSSQPGGGKGGGNSDYDGVRGLKSLGVRDLTYKMAFLACTVSKQEDTITLDEDEEITIEQHFTQEELDDIRRMRRTPRLYQRMVQSMAPAVFGHEEVKRGILLMLFGGVHKQTPEGINLRGDVNVCIVGDPSTSKSQFLKYVVRFMPRAIYTSGKASSAAGLTATVVKDPDTGEFNIEAGALMLADNGICCIDEFDKMDITDQVAIHEAMEQQTISIAKAGINATLNARTSILAAANPIAGRYDRSRTLKSNLNITPAIMSRFDLFFVVLDECDEKTDYNIARHIVQVHQRLDQAVKPHFSAQQLQRYIKFAKTVKPQLSSESIKVLVDHYRKLRQADVGSGGRTAYRITVRQLESMIRLSEALARLHCEPLVKPKYVDEAARLLRKSIIHVETEPVVLSTLDENDAEEEFKSEEEEEAAARENDMNEPKEEDDDTSTTKGAPSSSSADGKGKKKGEVKMSFERYRKISNLLAMHLQRAAEAGGDGMRQADLIQWYLDDQNADETEEEKEQERKTLQAIISRLVSKDNVLIDISAEPTGSNDDRVLIVHPNYNMD